MRTLSRHVPKKPTKQIVLNLKFWAPGMTLEDCEKEIVKEALAFHSNNRTHTARALDIALRSLTGRLRKWKLDVPAGRVGGQRKKK